MAEIILPTLISAYKFNDKYVSVLYLDTVYQAQECPIIDFVLAEKWEKIDKQNEFSSRDNYIKYYIPRNYFENRSNKYNTFKEAVTDSENNLHGKINSIQIEEFEGLFLMAKLNNFNIFTEHKRGEYNFIW